MWVYLPAFASRTGSEYLAQSPDTATNCLRCYRTKVAALTVMGPRPRTQRSQHALYAVNIKATTGDSTGQPHMQHARAVSAHAKHKHSTAPSQSTLANRERAAWPNTAAPRQPKGLPCPRCSAPSTWMTPSVIALLPATRARTGPSVQWLRHRRRDVARHTFRCAQGQSTCRPSTRLQHR